MNIYKLIQKVILWLRKKRLDEIPKCNKCEKEMSLLNQFKCHYCGEVHCDKHRLPEEHDCYRASKPKGLNSGRTIYSKGKTTYLKD